MPDFLRAAPRAHQRQCLRALVHSHRLAEALQRLQRIAQREQGIRIVGTCCQGLFGAGCGVGMPAEVIQDDGAVAPGVRGCRLQGQGAFVAVQRFPQAAEAAQRVAAVVPGQRVARVEAQRGVVGMQCRFGLAEVLQGRAEVAMRACLTPVDLQGGADQVDGTGRVALLARDHAAQMQGVELARRGSQHLRVQLARLLQPSLLVQGHGLPEQGAWFHLSSSSGPFCSAGVHAPACRWRRRSRCRRPAPAAGTRVRPGP
jgi:hypothetical protein